ncbi:MAG: HAD family hydrolase [Methylacidiphilales bacterium]|nr:HAD family hydrolase [Candidatus Methylacidiphilales bacterium]
MDHSLFTFIGEKIKLTVMFSPTKPQTLIIFDVDGTLLDANSIDYGCFDRAFYEVTGVNLSASMWLQFKEVTTQAIVHQALGDTWPDIASTKIRVKEIFLENLRTSLVGNPTAFCAIDGAVSLLSSLKTSPDFRVAIATGCWRETAHFKLKAAGFDLADIPFACASDCYARAEIISLAASRAGIPVEQAIYVGDGIWDLRATQKLGIPFIGVGRGTDALRQAGAKFTLDLLNADALSQVVRQILRIGES